jgi:chromosome segregation ATPase
MPLCVMALGIVMFDRADPTPQDKRNESDEDPVEDAAPDAVKRDPAEDNPTDQHVNNHDHETPHRANEQPNLASDGSEPKDRFDALVRDRDSLRAEVTDMRKSLEEIQSKHSAEMETLQQRLDDAESKKEQAETQFQKLLERVNTIKSQLGERLKEDAVRLNCPLGGKIWLIPCYRKNWPRPDHRLRNSRTRTQI